jgi:excisionase family DNA binding protein
VTRRPVGATPPTEDYAAVFAPLIRVIADGVREELSRSGVGAASRTSGSDAITPRLLTVAQAATYLGRSKASVQHLVAQRRIPVVREGRRIFLDVRELDRWIAANTEPAQGG